MFNESAGFYKSDVEEMPVAKPGVMSADGVTMTPDGDGMVVEIGGEDGQGHQEDRVSDANEFDGNLASELDHGERCNIGSKLLEYIEIDMQARADWEQRMKDGLEIIGLKDVPKSATAFDGASEANYPAISEAMVQFQARASEELLPPTGPAKCIVFGEQTEKKLAQAKRVEDYLNYQCTEQDDEYYDDTESLLMYLPYAGSAFKRVATDTVCGFTRSRFVSGVDVIVPYSAKSMKTAPRYAYRYTMPLNDIKKAQSRGEFIKDAKVPENSSVVTLATDNDRDALKDKSDDRTAVIHEDDTILTMYEMVIDYDFKDIDKFDDKSQDYKKPYVITFEKTTGEVFAIRRLWLEQDTHYTRIDTMVHFKFFVGFGFYGLGYLHLLGGLAKMISGGMRAVLDGSMTASLQGGFKTKDAKIDGDYRFTPGLYTDVDATYEELTKSFWNPPFKEPSPALANVLTLMIDAFRRFASTTEANVGEGDTKAPVGTTIAMIEQSGKVLSGVHRRIHAAQRRELRLMAFNNYHFMSEDKYPYAMEGGEEERFVLKDDFSDAVDVGPVSDPNITSSTQRIAVAQAVVQAATENPDVFKPKHKRIAMKNLFVALKVPNVKEYGLEDADGGRLDPVSENQSMLSGGAAQAFIDQDHKAHMTVHDNFKIEIMGMNNPELIAKIVPLIDAHNAEHFGMDYRMRMDAAMQQTAGFPMPPQPDDDTEKEVPAEIDMAIARAIAALPPPTPPQQQDPNAQADADAGREQDRKDMSASREQDRKDAEHMAVLKREGIVSDEDAQA